jgi:hypothetical protein
VAFFLFLLVVKKKEESFCWRTQLVGVKLALRVAFFLVVKRASFGVASSKSCFFFFLFGCKKKARGFLLEQRVRVIWLCGLQTRSKAFFFFLGCKKRKELFFWGRVHLIHVMEISLRVGSFGYVILGKSD